jgi:electron transport complex protein RnfD
VKQTRVQETDLLTVSAPPHLRAPYSTRRAMQLVIIALVPVFAAGVWFFGYKALLVTLVSVASCIGWEALSQRVMNRAVTVTDGSAVITGMLLAFNLPPGVPLWMPVAGAFFAIVIVKQLFGGLGSNFVNPALAGRAFLMASWPALMTSGWLAPAYGAVSGMDAVTAATPLSVVKNAALYGDPSHIIRQMNSWSILRHLFFGSVGGCTGETSALILLITGLFLVIIRLTDFRIVVGYLASFIVLVSILPVHGNMWFHLFSGGLLLGVFFMATDWVTTPVTKTGRWIFGIGCGVITVLIRVWGSYPEGVSYAILFMNICTPLINQLTRERIFGAPAHMPFWTRLIRPVEEKNETERKSRTDNHNGCGHLP